MTAKVETTSHPKWPRHYIVDADSGLYWGGEEWVPSLRQATLWAVKEEAISGCLMFELGAWRNDTEDDWWRHP